MSNEDKDIMSEIDFRDIVDELLWGAPGAFEDGIGPEPLTVRPCLNQWDSIVSEKKCKRTLERGPSRRDKRKKIKQNPKQLPSAYDIFFEKEGRIISKVYQGNIESLPPEDLEKIIESRWQALSPDERKIYEDEAEAARYRKETEDFEEPLLPKLNKSPFSKPPAILGSEAYEPILRLGLSSPVTISESSTPDISPTCKVQAHHPTSAPAPVCKEGASGSSFTPISVPATQIGPVGNASQSQFSPNHPAGTNINSGHSMVQASMVSPSTPTQRRLSAFHPKQAPQIPFLGNGNHESDTSMISLPPDPGSRSVRYASGFFIPDEFGRPRRYEVSYKCFRMTSAEADAYVRGAPLVVIPKVMNGSTASGEASNKRL